MAMHESLLLKPAQGWLVGCVMASLFVLMGASGDDVFARHVGTSVSSLTIPGIAADGDRPAAVSDARANVDGVLPAGLGHGTDDGDGAAHVLHLVGACVALLCAGAVLLHGGGWCLWSTRARTFLSVRLFFAASRLSGLRRAPPRLTPPRFSPAIRT